VAVAVGVAVGVAVDVAVGVALGVAVTVGVGLAGVAVAVAVGVGLGVPDCAQYFPPVFKTPEPFLPPQTIISLPVQTAVCSVRASGALVVLVGVQVLSVHVPAGAAITGSV
jgi:hypothetical protein